MSAGKDPKDTDTPKDLDQLTDDFVSCDQTGSGNTVHLPAKDSTREDPQPRCNTQRLKDQEWNQKSLSTRPKMWRTWCNRCRSIVETGNEYCGGGRGKDE